ncbi:hypothetical protein WJX73_002230, partial [Symbiochloris irregularis]
MDGNVTLPTYPKAERRSSAKGEAHPLLAVDVSARPDSADDKLKLTPPLTPTGGSNSSDAEAIFNMVNAVLGAGVLGYPFCFRSCGIGLAALLVLGCWGASYFSMRLLLLSAHLVGARTYEDLVRILLGRTGQQALTVCVVSLNLGCLVAYVNILADVLSSVAGSIIPPGAEPSRNALLAGITLFAVLPVALVVRSPEVLARVSQASVAFVFGFAAVVVYLALLAERPKQPKGAALEMWQWQGLLVAFPVIAYGFTAHQFLFGIYASLKAPSVRRMSTIVHKALLVCTLVYVVVGVGGYVAFRQRTSGDILRNFGAASGARVVKAITSMVLGAALMAAVLVPNVEFIFGLTGSTAAALMSFVFPAWVFLLAATSQRTSARADLALPQWQWDSLRHRAWLLLLVGLVVGVACTRATILAVHQENEVVALAQDLAASTVQVEEATRKHTTAVQVAETVQTVSTAAVQVGDAQLHANATRMSAAQAQAALESLDTSRAAAKEGLSQVSAIADELQPMQTDGGQLASGTDAAGQGGKLHGRRDGGKGATQEWEHQRQAVAGTDASHAAHVESFALGAVTANLRDMKTRLNSTMHTFEVVVAALNVTSSRLQQEQSSLELAQRLAENATAAARATGGEAAAAPEAAIVRATRKERDAGVKEAQAVARVQLRANETLAAVKATTSALAAAEAAIDVVERAKGKPEDPATKQAVEVMLAAVAATSETAKHVDATLAELQQLQEQQAARLAQLRKVKGDASYDLPRKALPADLRTGTAVLEDMAGNGSRGTGLQGSANVTLAAQAAVAAASNELGAALAGANITMARSQRQDPQVASRAEAIAKELGRQLGVLEALPVPEGEAKAPEQGHELTVKDSPQLVSTEEGSDDGSSGAGTEVFVGGLPSDATEEAVTAAFAKVGTVLSMRLTRRKRGGECKGFAFVRFPDQSTAERACAEVTEAAGKPVENGDDADKAKVSKPRLEVDLPDPSTLIEGFTLCKRLLDTFRASPNTQNKTPLAILHEYATRCTLELSYDEKSDSALGPFTSEAKLTSIGGSVTYAKGTGRGRGKKDAKQVAAAALLEELLKNVDMSEFLQPGKSKQQGPMRVGAHPGMGGYYNQRMRGGRMGGVQR